MNGSAEARADSALKAFAIVAALICKNKKSPVSPDLARKLSVPENECSVVPQLPLLHTAARVEDPHRLCDCSLEHLLPAKRPFVPTEKSGKRQVLVPVL